MSKPLIPDAYELPKTLTDLGVPSGISVQVETLVNGQRFKTDWVGSSKGGYVYIRSPQGAERLFPGTRLRVRLLHDNWACAFSSQLDSHTLRPDPLWVLSYPESIELARLRNETRLPIAIRVRVDGADPLQGPVGETALISDLHMGGAALESHIHLGEVGDQLFVTTRLNFAGTEHLVMLAAEIVNHSPASNSAVHTEHYGLAFAPMDDETRVYLRGFLAETRLASMGYKLD